MYNMNFIPEWYNLIIQRKRKKMIIILCICCIAVNIFLLINLSKNLSELNVVEKRIEAFKADENSFNTKNVKNNKKFDTVRNAHYLSTLRLKEDSIKNAGISYNNIVLTIYCNSFDEYKRIIKRFEESKDIQLKKITPLIKNNENYEFNMVLVKNE